MSKALNVSTGWFALWRFKERLLFERIVIPAAKGEGE